MINDFKPPTLGRESLSAGGENVSTYSSITSPRPRIWLSSTLVAHMRLKIRDVYRRLIQQCYAFGGVDGLIRTLLMAIVRAVRSDIISAVAAVVKRT